MVEAVLLGGKRNKFLELAWRLTYALRILFPQAVVAWKPQAVERDQMWVRIYGHLLSKKTEEDLILLQGQIQARNLGPAEMIYREIQDEDEAKHEVSVVAASAAASSAEVDLYVFDRPGDLVKLFEQVSNIAAHKVNNNMAVSITAWRWKECVRSPMMVDEILAEPAWTEAIMAARHKESDIFRRGLEVLENANERAQLWNEAPNSTQEVHRTLMELLMK